MDGEINFFLITKIILSGKNMENQKKKKEKNYLKSN